MIPCFFINGVSAFTNCGIQQVQMYLMIQASASATADSVSYSRLDQWY